MPIIIDSIEQGSDLWFEEKLAKPSASNASKIITNDGKPKEEWERPIESDEYYNSFCENGGNE